MEELQTISTLQGVEIALRKELEHIAEGYIKVGYLLKKTRDAEFYKKRGMRMFLSLQKKPSISAGRGPSGLCRSTIHTVLTGISPEIQEKYRGYGSSKLSEMLALPEEVRESGTKRCHGFGKSGR